MRDVTPDDVLLALSHHIGADKAIGTSELCRKITGEDVAVYDARPLRKAIEALRLQGHHVCALPGGGYFIARDAAELETYCDKRRTSLVRELKQLAAMQRVSLADLIGQQRLPG